MKHTLAILIIGMMVTVTGCNVTVPKIDVPKPVVTVPPIVVTQPSEVVTKECGCDLTGARLLPPYTDAQLIALGNSAECPVTFPGKDIRLAVMRPDGNAWLVGMLCNKGALTVDGNTFTCHCFDADGGRYHYLGLSRSDLPRDIVSQDVGVANQYNGTVFVTFELRGKK